MVRPSREQLALLSPLERANFELANLFASDALVPAVNAYLSVAIGALIYSCGGRRIRIRGLEHVKGFGKQDRVLFVANHRTYFDFFAVLFTSYFKTNLPKRFFCPIRSTFFYDHPLGPALNLSMSAMRMFPPIMRGGDKSSFNQFAVDRCAELLQRPGTLVCIHPEGTRSRSEDPFELLPPKPGAGHVALQVPRAYVIPVFTVGITNDLGAEVRKNWLAPKANPIALSFGAPIDLSDLRARYDSDKSKSAKLAAERMMERIGDLGRELRTAPQEQVARGNDQRRDRRQGARLRPQVGLDRIEDL